MRQIILDTETTGLEPAQGHRIIEIGCLELINRRLTGRQFHVYLNPERDVDVGAFKVHGISTEFLQDKPYFHQVSDEFMAFVKDAELIIHNAPFDIGFLNAELQRLSLPLTLDGHCQVLDTLLLAKQKHPGQRNNLDALCKRYNVDNANRELHGALLDAELLAFVYLAMTGGQITLFGEEEGDTTTTNNHVEHLKHHLTSHSPVYFATSEELIAHEAFRTWLEKKKR
jgi:DNA polymerase-3 subunit epsilon